MTGNIKYDIIKDANNFFWRLLTMTIINKASFPVEVDREQLEPDASVCISEMLGDYIGIFSMQGCARIDDTGPAASAKAWGGIMVTKSSDTIYMMQEVKTTGRPNIKEDEEER